jgi:hypothetical protein
MKPAEPNGRVVLKLGSKLVVSWEAVVKKTIEGFTIHQEVMPTGREMQCS